jgi:transcriptional regulator with XRE-family HTH domain
MTMSNILKSRTAKDISQGELATALGRSPQWVSLVEREQLRISTDTEDKILAAIDKLAAHRAKVRRAHQHLIEDLRLPRCSAV